MITRLVECYVIKEYVDGIFQDRNIISAKLGVLQDRVDVLFIIVHKRLSNNSSRDMVIKALLIGNFNDKYKSNILTINGACILTHKIKKL